MWKQDWKYYEFDSLKSTRHPHVIMFRPPPGKTCFGGVRQDGRRDRVLGDIFTSNDLRAVRLYTGIIPPGFQCNLVVAEAKILQYVE